jgi:chromosome segregation protein
MVFISRIKFRGFKSFRQAEVVLPKGFVCLAGPNGSGKSNVTDGIRFALGEMGLRSLRASKVAELINQSSTKAEVTLTIDGEQHFEVKRAIREDGKVAYRLDGKRVTRREVLEALRPVGLEIGSHNIIAQGQVQKIVEMNAKERRGIIDSIAGIAEFEEKKEEALGELGKVESRISDTNIVLSEREAILTQLEKEKNDALAYREADTLLKRSKATLVNHEYSKLEKSHNELMGNYTKRKAEGESLLSEILSLDSKIAAHEAERGELAAKINKPGERERLMAQIEEIKVSIGSNTATGSEKKKDSERLSSELVALETERKAAKDKLSESKAALSKMAAELQDVQSKMAKFERNGAGGESGSEKLHADADALLVTVSKMREEKAGLSAGLEKTQELLGIREDDFKRLTGGRDTERLTGELENLRKDATGLEKELTSLFENEKELNRQVPELDKKMLELKERLAVFRASAGSSGVNPAVSVALGLGMLGIYGTVGDLIKTDGKYSVAVEAACGQRLSYLVCDTLSTATAAIEKLKSSKSGRATFLPLDVVVSDSSKRAGTPPSGSLGYLIDFVEFDRHYERALGYVFGDTLLVSSVEAARKIGIGKARMISVEGELVERSGAITGGSMKATILAKTGMAKLEKDVEALKTEREGIYQHLYELREEMSRKRKEKAEAEVKAKGIELELGMGRGSGESQHAKIKGEMASLEKQLSDGRKKLEEMEKQIGAGEKKRQGLLTDAAAAEEKEFAEKEGEHAELREITAKKSSLLAAIGGKKEEESLHSSALAAIEEKVAAAKKASVDVKKSISEIESHLSTWGKQKAEFEEKLKHIGKETEALYKKMQEAEAKMKWAAGERGKLKYSQDRIEAEINQMNVKRATIETKLADLKVEVEKFAGVEVIDASREKLEEMAAKSETALFTLGNVNQKAPELYEQKKAEIEDVKGKVKRLEDEKAAVHRMIEEIDSKKRAIFIETFQAVNDNFKTLFSHIFPGEGTLVLEQPADPFASGLQIKVRDGKKDRYLDSMSGGEKSLLALVFIFSIQMHKAAPFYILDEADSSLDKANSLKLAQLLSKLSKNTQFIVVTHNDTVLTSADVALGVTKTDDGSKIVGVQLTQAAEVKVRRTA